MVEDETEERRGMIAVDEISHEYIYHGGCLLTRLEVYRLESVEGRPEVGIGSADWWAFSKPAADLTGVDVEAERQFAIQCFPELF